LQGIHPAIRLEVNFFEPCLLPRVQDSVDSCPHFGVALLHCCYDTCSCGSPSLTKTGELTAAALTTLSTLPALSWAEDFIQSRRLCFCKCQHSDNFRITEECGGGGSTHLPHHTCLPLTLGALPSLSTSRRLGNSVEGHSTE